MLVIHVAWGTGVTAKRNFGSSRAKWGAWYLKSRTQRTFALVQK